MLAPDIVAVLECIDDGVAILDAHGRLSHSNVAGARLFGFATPAALVAASPTEIAARCAVFDESGTPVSVASLTDAPVSHGDNGPEVLRRVLIRTTGEERWVSVRATPMVTAVGAHIDIRVFRDVTDRVQAEAQARQSLTRNRAILAALPDLLFLQTPDGTFVDYHAGDPAQLLVPPETFLGKTTREILPPEVADQLVPALERTARTGVPMEEQYAMEVGGEERFYETRLVRVEDGNVLSIVRDITDRMRAEAALAESRRLADRVAAASPAVLYVYDFAENRNVYINDALSRLLGYAPAQLTEAGTADLWALMHPDDLARWPEMGAQVAAAADGEVFEQNYRLRHANGDWSWLTQRVTVLSRQPDGRPHLIVGAALDVTDLRETEAALRASEARYRAVVDSQTEMICRYVPDTTTLTFVNDAYCRSTGRTKDELLSGTILDLVPASDRARVAAHLASLAADPRTAEIEHEVDLPDGTVGYQHWVDYPIRDDAGVVVEFQGIGRDVTALRRAEAALEERHRFDDRVGAASPDILYVFDVLTNRTIYVNDAIGRVLGYPAAELIAAEETDPMAMRHPDDRATLQAAVARVVSAADGEVVEFAFRMRHANGDWRWLAARVTVLSREPDGQPRQVVGALLDVTDLRRVEDALRESEAQLQLALKSAAMGSWDWRIDADWIAWSEHTGPLYGLPAGTPGLSSRQFYALIHPDDRRRVREIARRRAADSQPYSVDYRTVWPDGTIRWQERRGRAVAHDADGRATRYLGITMDVTARKRAEEELRQLSSRLLAVQDEERRHLARELHEQLAGTLVGLSLDVSSARLRLGEAADPEVDHLLADAETLCQQMLREVRTVSYVLHPPELDGVGLGVALREYAAGFARRSGVTVDPSGLGDVGRFSTEAESALFRVAQEALTNVARHAGTDHAILDLRRQRGTVILRVADNGRGMVGGGPNDAVPLGVGIAGMRARLHQLGGDLDIVSDASGTVVSARLPIVGGNGTRQRRHRVSSARDNDGE